jgi:prepilin-type N-terminal cleavage/methylation domain-containing protein
MKRAFSLIELIFTIVIIAFIFTTIPKIIYSTNEGFKFTLKEDGIFNMMAKIMDISFREWDENDVNSYDIMLTGNSNVLECDSSTYPAIRVGGFYSGYVYSRLCSHNLHASNIGPDSGESSEEDYDDVDDFNATESNATKNGNTRYILYITNGYSDEWNASDYDYTNGRLSFTFTQKATNSKSNIKFTKITLYDSKYDKNISHARYWSANIGKVGYIESEQW